MSEVPLKVNWAATLDCVTTEEMVHAQFLRKYVATVQVTSPALDPRDQVTRTHDQPAHTGQFLYQEGDKTGKICAGMRTKHGGLQGYLAHEKLPPP